MTTESLHRVVISVSYGDVSTEKYTHSTHMLSYSDVDLTEAEAIAFQEGVIALVCAIRHARTDKEVMGIYKTETPS